MTVHVHRCNKSISRGDHIHRAPTDLPDEQRTWEFDCTPECEERTLKAVEHTARHAAGVPLTVDEGAEADIQTDRGKKDVADLATSLAQLAKQRQAESGLVGATG